MNLKHMIDGELRDMTPEEEVAFLAAQVATAPIVDDKARELQQLAQVLMDDAAQARGYDDLKRAVGYAEEPAVPRFQAEG